MYSDNTFINAINSQPTTTENGMSALTGSGSAMLDLFYNAGASRGKNIIPQFVSAMVENRDLALRCALWLRDVRQGAGERQLFRDILLHLECHSPSAALALMPRIPELGRFDDLLQFKSTAMRQQAYGILANAIQGGNALAAKWTPRKGPVAEEFRKFLKLSPKQYRKTLVNLTKVVEQQMCSQDWDNINFSQVPSQATRLYRDAFNRHTEKYAEYVAKLSSGDTSVKVNASAVYPHEVLAGIANGIQYGANTDKTKLNHIMAQWNALPNWVGDSNILPLVDVSGSMCTLVGGSRTISCLDVAVSLGLYLADKNVGDFHGAFLTFSKLPQLVRLRGNILQKLEQMVRSNWAMNTNLELAMQKILEVASFTKVKAADMPKVLLILSDMQFDQCIRTSESAMQMIRTQYQSAGYEVPKVVFWNLRATGNVPVQHNEQGVAMVSGFSPSILQAILHFDLEQFTPENIMLKTLLQPRYNY